MQNTKDGCQYDNCCQESHTCCNCCAAPQSPNSDHNTGLAVDLTDDPVNGIDCKDIYQRLQNDIRVKYLIFKGKIWSKEKGEHTYKGSNQHNKHLHISIKTEYAKDDSNWFSWMGLPPKKK
jgi:hypothetical protein